jgi:hypothetical protein
VAGSVVASLVFAGCFNRHSATGVAANGQPLKYKHSVSSGTKTTTETYQETIVDENGQDSGLRIEREEQVTRKYRNVHDTFFQGTDKIAESDFYRIAGDPDTANDIDSRRSASRWQILGGGLFGVAGALTCPLFFAGILGDSTAIKYGGGAAACVAGMLGTLLVLKGAKTYKRDALGPMNKAIELADIHESCLNGRCSRGPGGRKKGLSTDEAAQLTLPPGTEPQFAAHPETQPLPAAPHPGPKPGAPARMQPPAPSASRVAPFTGTWRGKAAIEVRQGKGRPVGASNEIEIIVEKVGDSSVTVNPDPKEMPNCRLTAQLDDGVMTLDSGQSCQGNKGVSMTLRSGSLESQGTSLKIKLDMDVVQKKPGAMTTKVQMKTLMTGQRVR